MAVEWFGKFLIDVKVEGKNYGLSLNRALDLDDFKNRCGQGNHPLLKIIHAELQNPDASGVDGEFFKPLK